MDRGIDESLYITGDTHGNALERLSFQEFPESRTFRYEDRDKIFVLVLGDFGVIWHGGKEEKYILEWLEDRPFTTLFIDGNHENFTRLYQYPIENWRGGKVHRISPSVLHLMRGQVFEIGARKIFAFGGAACHDAEDGILDPNAEDYLPRKKDLIRRGRRYYRTLGVNYWKEELPDDKELQEGLENLEKHNNYVDYIITHCASTSIQEYVTENDTQYTENILTAYFEELRKNIRCSRWLFGHYHIDTPCISYHDTNIQCVYVSST